MSTTRTAPRITIYGILKLGKYSSAGVTHILSFLGPNSRFSSAMISMR
jgi:hypothetical protein